MMKYPVVEIFDSIQGEGSFTGAPANFIRLAGCPVQCRFCDTDYSKGNFLPITAILTQLNRLTKRVVITGGEPTMHNLAPLRDRLSDEGYETHLETSGIFKHDTHWTWTSVSPKKDTPIHGHYDEAKWLIPIWTYEEINWDIADVHWLQPLNSLDKVSLTNIRKCLDIIKTKTQSHFLGLSVQLHKLIGVK